MYAIATDTSANLSCDWLSQHEVTAIPFIYDVDGLAQTCLDTVAFDGKAYYDAIRQGARVKTSQVTPQRYVDAFEPILESGRDILFVGMSSGVSGSYSSAEIASAQLREAFPERRIRLVDTLGASLGEGLLVVRAAQLRDGGAALDAVADELIELRERMCQVFTVEDLKYLRMTGRLSNVAALVGSVLHIKPLLKGDDEGKIVCFSKVRGRRRSIAAMAEAYDKFVENAEEQIVGIAHADCPEDAQMLEQMLRRAHPPKEILTVCYEPVTGSHVGPGTLALFFLSEKGVRGKL